MSWQNNHGIWSSDDVPSNKAKLPHGPNNGSMETRGHTE